MSDERRQNILKVLTPSLAIGVVYIFAGFQGSQATLAKLERKLVAAKRQQPGLRTLRDQALELRALPERIAALGREQSSLTKELADVRRGRETAIDTTRRLEQLTLLLRRHELQLVQSQATDAELCDNIRWLLTEGVAPGTRRRFWRFELIGRYADVYLALEELAEHAPGALPLSLTLQNPYRDNPESPYRAWTLVVWV